MLDSLLFMSSFYEILEDELNWAAFQYNAVLENFC